MTIKKEFRVSNSLIRDLNRWVNELDIYTNELLNESKNLEVLIVEDLVNNSPSREKAIAASRHYEDVTEAVTENVFVLKEILNEIAGCTIIEEDEVKYVEEFDRSLDDIIRTINDLTESIPAYLKSITKSAGTPEVKNQKNLMLADFSNLGKKSDKARDDVARVKKMLVELKDLANELSHKKII
ncbi:MAG: hypothetical protein ACFFD4_24010 [Candidatus Odinarchaeota archaeon]